MDRNRLTALYFAVSITYIVLGSLDSVYPALIAKALIIPILMMFLHSSLKGKYSLFYKLIMTGLFFSFLGDVILQFAHGNLGCTISPTLLFIGGLGSFLVTQFIYLIAFGMTKGKSRIFTSRMYQTLLVLLFGSGMLYILYPGLGNLKIPVIAYTVVIISMLISALNRYGKVNRNSYLLVTAGAILFVISDSFIAFNKFYTGFRFADILIMVSYVTAQYLIVSGCLQQNKIQLRGI